MKNNKKNNTNTKKIITIMSLIIVITSIMFLTGCSSRDDDVIKIGFVTDLSGPASPYGLEIQRGAQLALNEINMQEKDFELTVIFEDDQCSGTSGTTAINKLINVDKVKLTGGTVCSNVALAIAPIVEQNKMIHLSTGASSPDVSNAGDYIFRVWPSDDFEAIVLADYAALELNLKSISILYVNTEFGVPLKNAFSQRFEENEGLVRSTEIYNSGDVDFKTQLQKISKDNSDGIYLITNPHELPLILKQIKELNIEATIISYGPPVEAEGVLESAKDIIEGLYYAHPNQIDSFWFEQAYETKYNTKPGLGASVGYDTIMLLFKAVDFCKSDNPDCVKDFFHSLENYSGASGNISFDENGDVHIPSVVKRIKNNVPIVIKE